MTWVEGSSRVLVSLLWRVPFGVYSYQWKKSGTCIYTTLYNICFPHQSKLTSSSLDLSYGHR